MAGPIDEATLNQLHANFKNGATFGAVPQSQVNKAHGTFLTHLLPSLTGTGGGLAGAAGGAAIGTALLPGIGTAAGGLLGALLGGAAGGSAGKVAENHMDHQALGSGVAKEAAINGVLSAGPLRLLKGGAVAGKVLTGIGDNAAATEAGANGGGRLMQALAAGTKSATGPSLLKTAAANKLDGTAENLAQRSLKINDAKWNTDFANRTGEEVGQFARRFQIPHNGLDHTASNVLQPGFDAHAGAVAAIGSIPKADILKSIEAQVSKELGSKVPASQEFGKSVIEHAQGVLDNFGDHISAPELNAVKTELAAQVNHGATDTASRTANEVLNRVSGGFRNSINTAASKAGIGVDPALEKLGYKAKNVGGLGEELSNLKGLLEKADVKSRTGQGTNPIGLTPAIMASTGGPGGIAAGAATQLINSTAGKRGLAKGVDAVASRLDKTAVKSGSPYSAAAIAKRTLPVGLLEALGGQSGNNSPTTANMTTDPSANNISSLSSVNDPNATGVDPATQDDPNSPLNPANIEANVQAILAGGGKMSDATAYLSLVKTMQDLKGNGATTKPMNSTSAGVVSDTQQGIKTLGDLSGSIAGSNANNPILGKLRGMNPLDTNAQALQAQINAARQIIGKAMEGGVLRKEDEVKYAKILPTMTDTDAVAQAKIQYIQQQLAQKLGLYQQNIGQGGGGTDTSSLLSALGAQ